MGYHETEPNLTQKSETDTNSAEVRQLALEELESFLIGLQKFEKAENANGEQLWRFLFAPNGHSISPVETLQLSIESIGGYIGEPGFNVVPAPGQIIIYDSANPYIPDGKEISPYLGTTSEHLLNIPTYAESSYPLMMANGHVHLIDQNGRERPRGIRFNEGTRCKEAAKCIATELIKPVQKLHDTLETAA